MVLLVAIVVLSALFSGPGPVPNPTQHTPPSIMAETQERDPSTPASTIDIIQIMFKFIAEQMEAERKLTKAHSDADRDLTDAKIRKVIECLNDKIEKTVTKVIKRFNQIMAHLDLKIETTSSYNEQP